MLTSEKQSPVIRVWLCACCGLNMPECLGTHLQAFLSTKWRRLFFSKSYENTKAMENKQNMLEGSESSDLSDIYYIVICIVLEFKGAI